MLYLLVQSYTLCCKGPYADYILIPWDQPEVVYLFGFNSLNIFLIANLKFRLESLGSFGFVSENVKLVVYQKMISYVFSS